MALPVARISVLCHAVFPVVFGGKTIYTYHPPEPKRAGKMTYTWPNFGRGRQNDLHQISKFLNHHR